MGKSYKKVAEAPVFIPPTKKSKKGKRDADKVLEKCKSSKKQKREVQDVEVKQKIVKASEKANVESTSNKNIQTNRSWSPSNVEEEKSNAPKLKHVIATKKKFIFRNSSSENEGDVTNRKLIAAPVVSKKYMENSDDSDIDSDGENMVKKKPTAPTSQKTQNSTSPSESDSDVEDMVGSNKRLKTSSADVGTNERHVKPENEPDASEYQLLPSVLTTVFVGNLSFKATKDDVLKFFEKAGEVIEVRFAANEDGSFRGFGHVEFGSEWAAQNALKLHGQKIRGRRARIALSCKKSSDVPNERKESNSCDKVEHDVSQTVFVKGFHKSLEEDKIRCLLEEHFGSCGEIMRVSIPQDKETGRSKGFAFVLFNDQGAVPRAFELNGTNLGGCTITVKEPSTLGDNHGRASSGVRPAGQGVARRGGRGRGRGGRQRGSHFKQNVVTASTGKKTKFADRD
ncbi:Nucleolin 2 [Apostasia shenzhenica]|uniref:Nucleolin 2 n=1 Tax=Apostasia shenzhenica TaxID=1088818 RepID=A0A2I0AMK0_9ASPA|nr:Nucleolin 2 [Apostasia shenzhenica]